VQVHSLSIPQALLPIGEFGLDTFWHGHLEQDNIKSGQWLELLHPLMAVKALCLSTGIAAMFVPALQELAGERATEVLPTLQSLFLENPNMSDHIQKAIRQFTATQELSGHP
jgi:hypothetical protein